MSTLVVTTITTGSNIIPLSLTTGNTAVGIDIIASNSTIRLNGTIIKSSGQVLGAGKQTMWLPAAAFSARLNNGPGLNQIITITNLINYKTFDFDPATIEYIEATIRMPKSWDKGTLSFTPVHSQLTTSAGAASWNLMAACISSSDGIDVASGTPVTVTVSGGTANTLYIGTESTAVTASGSPQDGDLLLLTFTRAATLSADTLAIDARFHGVNIFYTANTDSDL
jgi:hypothetical protein